MARKTDIQKKAWPTGHNRSGSGMSFLTGTPTPESCRKSAPSVDPYREFARLLLDAEEREANPDEDI